MNIWEEAIITKKGLALQAKLHSGTTLSLTRAVAGAGTVDAAMLQYQTSVTDERKELSFSLESYPEEGSCAVPMKLDNSDVDVGFTATQIGVYAFDPDEGEILYLIAQAVFGEGTIVPSKTEMPGYVAVWTLTLQYGQADGVTVTVNPSGSITTDEVKAIVDSHNTASNPHAGILATKADLDAHTGNTENPHGVTAEQLGLGKVDNTPDTEKYVAFSQESGEARKVQNALTIRLNGGRTENTDMWTFDGSTGRTVNITAEKVGAAEEEHEHSSNGVSSLLKHYYMSMQDADGTAFIYLGKGENFAPGLWLITSNAKKCDVHLYDSVDSSHMTKVIEARKTPLLLLVTENTVERTEVVDVINGTVATAELSEDGTAYVISTSSLKTET